MSRLCLGFEVHQPFRLRQGPIPGNGADGSLEDGYFNGANREILERVADKCYVPATRIVLDGLDRGFKCAFSLSGTLVEQLEMWRPDVLDLFRQVAAHRNAELLAQTYYHSIASLFDRGEFEEQVRLHVKLMQSVFGVTPKVMENTEFIFNNGIARSAKKLGFKAIYAEGVERVLGWRSPNYVYSCHGIRLLMRNYIMSDDVAFRFNDRQWDQYPLMADKYASWIAASPGDYVNVFVDYETFGEHHWEGSGILEFLRWLPRECENRNIELITPSEAARIRPMDEIDIEKTISWADVEKDDSAWLGNPIQQAALRALRRARAFARDKRIWRYLQTSDHFYYMASKPGPCGEVHSYFSPDACGPYNFFASYMRALSHYERTEAHKMAHGTEALELRALPPDEAFRLDGQGEFTAYGLDDLCDMLDKAPKRSVERLMRGGDFSRWARDVLGDDALADAMAECESPQELADVAEKRRAELWAILKEPSS